MTDNPGQPLVDPGCLFERWERRSRESRPRSVPSKSPDLPPWAWRERPETSLVARFAHMCMNKSKQPVLALAWTPEGRRVLTGSLSGEFTLWNSTSFQFEMLMQAHENAVRALAWSHRGDWLISGDVDGGIKVWQPNFNNVNIVNKAHREGIRGVAWSPSDAKFVTGSDDALVKIWSFASMQEETALQGHGWDVNCVDWHPSLGMVVSGSKDNFVKLWDPRTGGRCLETLAASKNTVWKTKFQPGGGQHLLAACGRDQSTQIYDLRNLSRPRQTLRGEPSEVMALAWHPVHPQFLATGSHDGSVSQYLLDDVELSSKPALTIPRAHHTPIWDLAWHPAGHMLATGSHDRSLRFWTRPTPDDPQAFDPRFFTVTRGDSLLDPTVMAAEQPIVRPRKVTQESIAIPGLE